MRAWCAGWITAALLLQCVTTATAQTWSLTARGGWSHAGLSGDQWGGDYVNGIMGSIGAALRIDEDMSMEFDVAYTQKGAKGRFEVPSDPPLPGPLIIFEGEASLDYVEFWTLFAAHFGVAERSAVKGYLGVSLGTLLKAEATGTANGYPVEVDLEDELSSVDWAGIVGAGFTYSLSNVTVFVDVMAEIGFANINDTDVESSLSTRAYYTIVGVTIPLIR